MKLRITDVYFGELYLAFESQLIGYLTQMLTSYEQAREVAQESFVALYRAYSPERLKFPRAALFKIAKRFALMRLRRRRREFRYWGEAVDLDDLADLLPDESAAPADREVMAEQIRDCLVAAIKGLEPAYRKVLVMALLQGRTHKEIAVAVGASEKRVEKRIAKAIKVCRSRLDAYDMRLSDLLGLVALCVFTPMLHLS